MKKTISLIRATLPHLAVLTLILIPLAAFADTAPAAAAPTVTDGFIPLNPIGNIITSSTAPSLPNFFNGLYKICIGAAATIAVLQIMRAGFMFMVNKGSVSHNEAAKSIISNSILGLVLVLSPAIVFGIINPKILNLDLDVTSLQPKPTAQVDLSSTSTSTTVTTTAAGTKYLLAYYYSRKNISTNYQCFVSSVHFYNTQNECSAALAIVKSGVISPESSGTSRSSITYPKSCEATASTDFSINSFNNLPRCP